jgi:hypothetical protein
MNEDHCSKTKHLVENEQAPDKFGAGCKQEKYNELGSREHDKIVSRTTGRTREISMGMHGAGLVPRNPFASLAQAGYMHSHPEILGKKGLAEWDTATKGKKLPKHVKSKG